MAEEEHNANALSFHTEGDPKSSVESQRHKKNKKRKQFMESEKVEDEHNVDGERHTFGGNLDNGDMRIVSGKKKIKKKFLEETSVGKEACGRSGVEREKRGKKKRKKQLLVENADDEENELVNMEGSTEMMNLEADKGRINEEGKGLMETSVGGKEQEVSGINLVEEKNEILNDGIFDGFKKKKKRKLLKEAAEADRRGICYLSRIPPHMNHVKLRHILSQYGEIQRIYLAPEVNKHRVQSKRADKLQEFSEGWVEFTNKSVAKRVANMLNGEQIGGRKRSKFFYDLWNIKYLSKFKWDDLTEEIAYKRAIREQQLALELSAAKRERDFYLSKVEKSRALSSIEERLKKKQKVQQETVGQLSISEQAPKVIRQFPQTKPVGNEAEESKSQLSKDILAGVFAHSQ